MSELAEGMAIVSLVMFIVTYVSVRYGITFRSVPDNMPPKMGDSLGSAAVASLVAVSLYVAVVFAEPYPDVAVLAGTVAAITLLATFFRRA